MAVSHIMLEAYKKHVLVSLILHGKVCSLMSYIMISLILTSESWHTGYNVLESFKGLREDEISG